MRFSRKAYQRMYESGVFGARPRVELRHGEVVMMLSISPEHLALIRILNEYFARHLPETLQCRIQAPILLSKHSEPEPDLTIVRARPDNCRREHPEFDDTFFIFEVSQYSRQRDLKWKRRVYAISNIPEYWVVDVDEQLAVVHREPTGGDYRRVETTDVRGVVLPSCAPGCQLEVA